MKVNIGQKIREVFEERNMKLIDFADQLGTVRQNVYRIFKKNHVDTGLLLKISQVLNHNFFKYYVHGTTELTPVAEDNIPPKPRGENEDLEKKFELAKKEIDYLHKIIKLMEEKADLLLQFEKDMIIH
jgi:transcriptional regulator with XRE-family HTH domain